MNRAGNVYFKDVFCGVVSESDSGYTFIYDFDYLKSNDNQSISLTLPLTNKPYHSKTLFAFFDGLIPEGWLLDIALNNWKINEKDRMELLLTVCKDCIGAVSIEREEE